MTRRLISSGLDRASREGGRWLVVDFKTDAVAA
jgi:ATP-dependent exoDNAse (exonuclease V) beta subunit